MTYVVLLVVVAFSCLIYLILHRKRLVSISSVEPARQPPQTWEYASIFEKKSYLFDSTSEFNFFKILIELFGDHYYVFPQVNVSHLIEPRNKSFYEYRKNRSRIEKKSVDFVICDKERVVPKLVIELDGRTHEWPSRVKRDIFINELMKDVDLPILHIQTNKLDRAYVKGEIDKALNLPVA